MTNIHKFSAILILIGVALCFGYGYGSVRADDTTSTSAFAPVSAPASASADLPPVFARLAEKAERNAQAAALAEREAADALHAIKEVYDLDTADRRIKAAQSEHLPAMRAAHKGMEIHGRELADAVLR